MIRLKLRKHNPTLAKLAERKDATSSGRSATNKLSLLTCVPMHLIPAPVLLSSMPHAAVGKLLAFLEDPAAYFQQAVREPVGHSMDLHVCDDASDCIARRPRRNASLMASIFNLWQGAAQHICMQRLAAAHTPAVR